MKHFVILVLACASMCAQTPLITPEQASTIKANTNSGIDVLLDFINVSDAQIQVLRAKVDSLNINYDALNVNFLQVRDTANAASVKAFEVESKLNSIQLQATQTQKLKCIKAVSDFAAACTLSAGTLKDGDIVEFYATGTATNGSTTNFYPKFTFKTGTISLTKNNNGLALAVGKSGGWELSTQCIVGQSKLVCGGRQSGPAASNQVAVHVNEPQIISIDLSSIITFGINQAAPLATGQTVSLTYFTMEVR
jgi:hypothetical protein